MSVTTPSGRYDVVIGSGLLARVDELIPRLEGAEKAFVITDATVAGFALAPLVAALARRGLTSVPVEVPSGESCKTLAEAERLYRALAGQEAHRDDPIFALGGGSVGDLAGFVASTYMRGMPFVQVPTSLTSQVDASVGGKTAVNLPEGKNLIGTFHQPSVVVSDVSVLSTLPAAEYRAGLAEVAKVALALDPVLLGIIEGDIPAVLDRRTDVLEAIVEACVRAKARLVSQDERDRGGRLFLNYGHTLGHALERIAGFGSLSHGDAVAVGMRFASRLAVGSGVGTPDLVARHDRLLDALGFDPAPALPDLGEISEALKMDKKYSGGSRFVLLDEIGSPRVVDGVPDDQVASVLIAMGART